MQVEDESGSEEEVLEIDEESVEIDAEEDTVVSKVLSGKKRDNVVLDKLGFEDVAVNSWVLVLHEEDKFLGWCLSKTSGICSAQLFEKKIDVVHYDKVYKLSIIPCATELDDDRKDARKKFYKY